jgi:hypothetical protein
VQLEGVTVSDFCFSRPMLNRVMRQAEVMDRVMERIGVDPAVATRLDRGMGWYEARSRCIACCNEALCANWLRRSLTVTAELPTFCPNAAFFHACESANVIDPSLSAAMEDHHEQPLNPRKTAEQVATHAPQSQIEGGTRGVPAK